MTEESSRNEVHIVSRGARTAVGASSSASSAAVRAAVSRFGEHPFMIDKNGVSMIVAQDAFLPAEADAEERFTELMLSAAGAALEEIGLRGGRTRIGLFLGLPAGRPGLPRNLADVLGSRLERAAAPFAPPANPKIFQNGHAAGLLALDEAVSGIVGGSFDLCLVGGVDSYLIPETLEWLDEVDRIHSADNAWGFIPGEAAGFVLLASSRWVGRFGADGAVRVAGVSVAREPHPIDSESICVGEGLTESFAGALEALPNDESQVDWMICDLNGEPYRADEFGYTLVRTSDRFLDAANFLTPADCWGDVGAASGPLFITLAVAASARGYAAGPHTLTWASSDDGLRCAALIRTQPTAMIR